MTFFRKKMFIFTPKISDDLFLVIDLVFQILRCLLVYCDKMSHTTLSSHEKLLFQKRIPSEDHFFTLFVLSHASDNTTSLNIGGPNACMGRPPPQIFLGDR